MPATALLAAAAALLAGAPGAASAAAPSPSSAASLGASSAAAPAPSSVAASLGASSAVAFEADPLAPVLVHDRDETVLADGIAAFGHAPAGVAGGPRGRVVYRRVYRRPGGGTWRQYWLFFPDNRQDRGIFRTGRHVGDWELVQYRLDARDRPVEAIYAQHSTAERCPWSSVRRTAGGHPVVFLANGSHASYFVPGLRDRVWPEPNDEADGRGAAVRPRVLAVTERSPGWIAWPGRWGPSRRSLVPGEADSPRGPAFQPAGRWTDPDAFARSARECGAERCDAGDECDDAEAAVAGGGVAVVAVLGLVVRWWRRRLRRRAAGELQH